VSGESLRDRLSALSRAEMLGLSALVCVTIGGASLWYLRSLPKPVQVRASVPAPVSGATTASPSAEPAMLVVDIAGWVRRPGVYELHEGDRVIDALEAAGGARHGAALASLNLAAPLTDGVQVLVPRAAPGASSGAVDPITGAAAPTKVNLNTASAADLEALPGIGEVLAQRIVDYRTQNGPFTSVDQLVDVSGIGDAILADIRDSVTV